MALLNRAGTGCLQKEGWSEFLSSFEWAIGSPIDGGCGGVYLYYCTICEPILCTVLCAAGRRSSVLLRRSYPIGLHTPTLWSQFSASKSWRMKTNRRNDVDPTASLPLSHGCRTTCRPVPLTGPHLHAPPGEVGSGVPWMDQGQRHCTERRGGSAVGTQGCTHSRAGWLLLLNDQGGGGWTLSPSLARSPPRNLAPHRLLMAFVRGGVYIHSRTHSSKNLGNVSRFA